MEDAVSPRDAVKEWDVWELLGTPYLDTSHDTEWSIAFSEELKARGIVGLRGLKYRLLALAGFWWNFLLWWEWAYLGKQHLIWGWVLNGVLLAATVVGFVTHWMVGVLVFFVLQWLVWPLVRRRLRHDS
jgi:hypothetical protein